MFQVKVLILLLWEFFYGYPIGAKIVAKQKEEGTLTLAESERLLAFTSNSSPLFIIGSVGITMFNNIKIGIILLITHILACLTVGFLFSFWKRKEKEPKVLFLNNTNINKTNNLGEIFSNAIFNSINSILTIGGFIVIFSVIISILENLGVNSFVTGFLELTNGLVKISATNNIPLASFVLGFGGLCVAMQVYSISSNAKIPIKSYLIGKFLQGIFASFYTYLFLHFWFAC